MALCATTALAGAVPRPCVCGAGGRFGGLGPVPGVVSLLFPTSRHACSALRVAGRPVRLSLTLARWYAIPRGLCVPRAWSGCPSGSTRVPFACVCARAPAASAPPPLGGVACTPRAVPALRAGRAVPRGPCPSACPAPVPCGFPTGEVGSEVDCRSTSSSNSWARKALCFSSTQLGSSGGRVLAISDSLSSASSLTAAGSR